MKTEVIVIKVQHNFDELPDYAVKRVANHLYDALSTHGQKVGDVKSTLISGADAQEILKKCELL